jgi:hypothetical protein
MTPFAIKSTTHLREWKKCYTNIPIFPFSDKYPSISFFVLLVYYTLSFSFLFYSKPFGFLSLMTCPDVYFLSPSASLWEKTAPLRRRLQNTGSPVVTFVPPLLPTILQSGGIPSASLAHSFSRPYSSYPIPASPLRCV